jgi:predicted nicotinamide N-methyase
MAVAWGQDCNGMHGKVNSADCGLLSALLQRYLPGARAVPTPLPDCRGLSLYLLNGDYPQCELDADAVAAIINYPAYWAFCWASGQVLARFLLQNPQWAAGKKVLDFGSGSGVAGIAAALAGARQVVACDIDGDARAATGLNAGLNAVQLEIAADYLEIRGEVDLILAADVLYDRDNLPWLEAFRLRAPQVLVADSRVRNFDIRGYRKLGQEEATTIPDLDEFAEFRQVSLYLGSAGGD